MPLVCVNKGGKSSRIYLTASVQLEQPQTISVTADCIEAWQLRAGQIITAQSESGYYRCRLTALKQGTAEVVPFQPLRPPESPLTLTVAQAIPARERFELVLEKLTELGVAWVVPLVTQRSSTRAERDAAQPKSHRWPEVIRRAAQQCRRATVPLLADEIRLEDYLSASREGVQLVLDEQEATQRLVTLPLERPRQLTLIVGPEGGFTASERSLFSQYGVQAVSLGARILRTETAAMIAAALVQSQWGDLGR